ncbi:MAG: hypothetical protein H7122_06205 [Chitinophagaceae bacterium]|nr:hypothetical protein [Chitinophagaceae bacterium]
MKKIFFCILTQSFVVAITFAQIPSVTIDTSDRKGPLRGAVKNSLLSLGRVSHTTSRGTIYSLPYDNMPCLVPHMDQLARMPGSIQRVPENKMPNAMPRREMIPKQKKP